MKIAQTFWMDAEKNPLVDSFGWIHPKFHLMSWALSCLQLKKHFSSVDLITDIKGKELLVDLLKLPYDHINICLDQVTFDTDPRLWVLNKIYAYSVHEEPFINVDGDVYIYYPFPIFSGENHLVAQNVESDFYYYRELLSHISDHFNYIPEAMKDLKDPQYPFNGSNAGILGGSNLMFFKDYFEEVHRFTMINKTQIMGLNDSQMNNFNAIVEQHFFYALAKERSIEINYLFESVTDPSFEGYADFHYLPDNKSYLHALGAFKKNGWVNEQLAHRLFLDFPEYYHRINQMFFTDNSTLVTKIFENKGFNSFNKLSESHEEVYFRTFKLINYISEVESIKLEVYNHVFDLLDDLKVKLNDLEKVKRIEDLLDFEKSKHDCLQNFQDRHLIKSYKERACYQANKVFDNHQFSVNNIAIQLSPLYLELTSEWDWSSNVSLYGTLKDNNLFQNFTLEPQFYQVLLLFDLEQYSIIEHLLNPIEMFLLSMFNDENPVALHKIVEDAKEFFDTITPYDVDRIVEESVRFLAYSGILYLSNQATNPLSPFFVPL